MSSRILTNLCCIDSHDQQLGRSRLFPLNAWTWRLAFCAFAAVIGTSFTTGFIVREFVKFSTLSPDIENVTRQLQWQNTLAKILPFVFFANKLLPLMGPTAAMTTKIGHRRSLMIGAIVGFSACVIALGQALFVKENLNLVFLLRSLVCVMLGLQSANGLVVAPAYLVEVAPDSARGSFGALYGFFYWFGVTVAFYTERTFLDDEKALLIVFPATGLFLYAIHFVLLLFVEKSPRWLIQIQQQELAIGVVLRLHKCSGKEAVSQVVKLLTHRPETPNVDTEEVRQNGPQLYQLSKSLFLGTSLLAANYLTGAHVFNQLQINLADDGIAENNSYETNSIIMAPATALVSLGLMALSVLLVDRIGRRPLILLGLIVMTLAYIPIAIGPFLQIPRAVQIGTVAFMAAYSIGPGPIGTFMIAEMFEQRVRLCAMSACCFATQLIPASWFEMPVSQMLYERFIMPVAIFFCILEMALLYFMLPETKQMSLERAVAKFKPDQPNLLFWLDFTDKVEGDTVTTSVV